jgi:hypothetical protein
MGRYAIGMLLFALLIAGCAGIQVPTQGVFPCRISFEGRAESRGVEIPVAGAAHLTSTSNGLAQIYGPLGLAAFTAHMQDGKIEIMDMWGHPLKTYTVPIKQCIGLLAGVPLEGPYLYRRHVAGGYQIVYVWGEVLLDQAFLPREMHVNTGERLDLYFRPHSRGIHLLMDRGSDKLDLQIKILEGGRWPHAQDNL